MKYTSSLRTLAAVLAASAALQACVPLVAAGVGTGVVASIDRRSYGIQLEDTEIEHRFNRQFPEALEKRTNVSATSYNRWVLLTGQASDAESRSEVEKLARSIRNVREVVNEISIGYPSSFTSRSNDVLLTSSVKGRLFNSAEISGNHIKVVTESGTVYLMGLVTEREANIASEIARTTNGVQKVVRVFEVISPEEARRISLPQQAGQSAPQ